jgi:hypothetical protein
MTRKTLLGKLQYWGYSNDFARAIWRRMVPAGLCNYIANFTIKRDNKIKQECLTKKLVEGIENKSVNFDKSADVLSFLKKNPDDMLSPDFFSIWLEEHAGFGACLNFKGAILPYTPPPPFLLL